MHGVKKVGWLNYLAVLSVFIFSGAGTFMNAAVQTMIEAWPALSATTIRMVVSLPPLVSLPVMLLIGSVVGKRMSYRFCAILGTTLIALGGIAPYFFHSSWTLILVFRAILGVGVGFLGMRNPLILLTVPEEKQAAYIGYGSVVMNLGATVAAPVVGWLSQYSWRHPFLFDALAFIPVAYMLIFLREPKKQDVTEAQAEVKHAGIREGFTWRTWYYVAMQLLTTAVLYPLLSGLATYMADKQIGTALLAGTLLSAYTLSGMAVNMVLNPIMRVLNRYTIGVMCLLIAFGLSLVLFVPSVPTLFIGVILSGAGFNLLISVFQVYNGMATKPASMAMGSTVILAMLQLGIFISTYFISLCHAVFGRATDVESSYWGCLLVYIVMAVIAFVVKVAPEDHKK